MAISPEVVEAARRAFVEDAAPPSLAALERIRPILHPAYQVALEKTMAAETGVAA